ncbi:MAG: response regulator [Chloroflexi bacterium]|nr:response regulator [Chloroflexota bacterium]
MQGKILIVDDDIDTLQLVGTMLERQGFKIVAANNGQQAIQKASDEKPDLIILDVMMPGMDGYEVTRKLRAMEHTAFIPIILFTAKTQVDDKVTGFESGADDYLTKPTHPTELIARVRSILTRPKTGSLSLEQAHQEEPAGKSTVIGLIAAKGGLGVSTLALNLAISIHSATDDYVTLAEMRPGQGDISVYLGYADNDALGQLLSRPYQEIRLQDVEERLVTHGSGIQMLLASYNPKNMVLLQAVEQFETIVKHLSRIAPYTILDLGVGMSDANRKMLAQCSKVVVIIEPSPHVIAHSIALLENLKERGIPDDQIYPVIVNRQRLEITMPIAQIQKAIGRPPSVVMTPAPELAYQSALRKEPMITQQPQSLVAGQISKLAEILTAEGQK